MESLISRLSFVEEVFNSRLFHMSRQLWREDYYKVLGVPRNASQKESQLEMSVSVTKLLFSKDDKLNSR
jgi:hypothetical protein